MDTLTPTTPAKLEMHDIRKRFRVDGRVVTALDGVSLTLQEGEFLTLVGPSGCGKSTLLNIACGLQQPDQGEVWLDGEPARQRLGRLAYMPQRDLLLPWRTVLGNVLLGPELAGRSRDEARQEALSWMPLFGLEGFEEALPTTLSGGMKQRAALLRTFLLHREVMLLDEPFGALDALTRVQLQEWLLSVWRRLSKTILFVTHDVEEAILLSDRVLVMTPRPGRLRLEVEIPLARPRDRELVCSTGFGALKEKLLEVLTDQAPEAAP
ncbi:MAG: ABC transporter ATP-binding protein [Chloroflexi bacterium]|nr:ABC transporter ATP-binding protein [Chloroflexota bacterium]